MMQSNGKQLEQKGIIFFVCCFVLFLGINQVNSHVHVTSFYTELYMHVYMESCWNNLLIQ